MSTTQLYNRFKSIENTCIIQYGKGFQPVREIELIVDGCTKRKVLVIEITQSFANVL